MSSLDRVFDVLNLFSEKHPVWTVDDAMAALGHPKSTLYRYFKALTKAGLVVSVCGAYGLGPRIVELDQKMRIGDPLIGIAKPLLGELHRKVNSVILLMRLFHHRIICIHELGGDEAGIPSVSRGQSLTLFRGATSKVILAHLPTSHLKDIYLAHASEIDNSGLGKDWMSFAANLKVIRKRGYQVGEIGQIVERTFSIAVPIFDGRKRAVGAVTVLQNGTRGASPENPKILKLVRTAADEITQRYSALELKFATNSRSSVKEEFQNVEP